MPWHSCKTGFHCLALDSAIKIAHSAWRSATLISLSAHWLILLYINISCCLLEENEFSLICSLNICFKLFRNLLQNLSHILERNVYFVVCMSCPICRKKRIIKTSRIKKKPENVLTWIIYALFCNGKSSYLSYQSKWIR